jgi:hypothetical protein
MNVFRDKNGIVCVNEQFELSAEHQQDMQRLPEVVAMELAFRETPTVTVSACISVLTSVLLIAGGDPLTEARIIGDALQLSVHRGLEALGQTSRRTCVERGSGK